MTRAGLVLALLLVTACSGNPRPMLSDKVIDRALAGAPGEAQPSRVVATEIAFARAAREDGQWTAFARYAAPGALIHGRNGPVPAEAVYREADPPEAVQWAPREIWMSCDGSLAVTQGRYRDPAGLVGNFVTVWQRQRDGEYRYVYDMGGPDDPQPEPSVGEPLGENDIVVTAIDAVRADIADCPDTSVPPPPPVPVPGKGARSDAGFSADGTLRWTWFHEENGARVLTVDLYRRAGWDKAHELRFAPASQD